ncbi:hypothetical protein GQ600_12301 [Phytophthora cactorum]|nr:hypothetical protein GQ600_12301 [Phytophthora cactorum]
MTLLWQRRRECVMSGKNTDRNRSCSTEDSLHHRSLRSKWSSRRSRRTFDSSKGDCTRAKISWPWQGRARDEVPAGFRQVSDLHPGITSVRQTV